MLDGSGQPTPFVLQEMTEFGFHYRAIMSISSFGMEEEARSRLRAILPQMLGPESGTWRVEDAGRADEDDRVVRVAVLPAARLNNWPQAVQPLGTQRVAAAAGARRGC